MMKRILLSVFLICILIVVSVSCTKIEEETVNTEEDDSSLSIYIYDTQNKAVIEEAIDIFNQSSNVEMKKKMFQKDEREEYKKKLAIELMSGVGPDIVLIHRNDIQSPQKVMKSKVFFNLDEYVSKDDSFDITNYNPKVLESGVVGGNRYIIPLGYNICAIWGNISNMKNNQVDLNLSNWSWKELGEIATKFMQSSTDDNEYFIASHPEVFLKSMMVSGNNIFVNYAEKTSNFNSIKFVELLKLYKKNYIPSIVPYEIVSSVKGWFGKTILWDWAWTSWDNKWRDGSFNESLTYKYYVMPTISQDASAYLEPCLSVGVTSKCQNKKEAYDFIRILLSKDIQKKLSYFPVNKEALKESTYIIFENIDKGPHAYEDRDKIINHQVEIIERDAISGYVDYSIIDIVKEEIPDYLNGKKSAEQIAQEIDTKVAIYLNE